MCPVNLGSCWNVHALTLALIVLALLPGESSQAAGVTIGIADRNGVISVQDAMPGETTTQLLYFTRPVRGQAQFGERCATNVYLLEVLAELSDTSVEPVAENFCEQSLALGSLLANGDAVIVSGDRVETWRRGAGRIHAWTLGGVNFAGRGWKLVNDGNPAATPIDLDRQGNLFMAGTFGASQGDATNPSGTVVAVSSRGELLWLIELVEPGVRQHVVHLWAAGEGGALLHVVARPSAGPALPGVTAPAGGIVVSQDLLYRVSADGRMSDPVVIIRDVMPDMSAPAPRLPDPGQDPAAYQETLATLLSRQAAATSGGGTYLMESIVAAPGYGGDMNLLLRSPGRETRFLRLDGQGRVSRDQSLTEVVENDGLSRWKDFRADDNLLMLFGAVSTRVNRLSQGFISWIALDGSSARTRLAPLSDLGLEAARRAGDEEIQHLEHWPAHQPVLLTRLGGKPLAVSQVRISRRPALQLDEGTDQLLAYTEARDEQQAQRLREARSVQRRTEREETLRQQSAKLAAAIGVSPEQYAAMSNQERKQAMVRDGDFDAIQSMVAEQAAATREMMSAGAPPQDMSSQMASAMAGLQKQLADDPNLTPEMRAQMMAMLTQMGQAAGARAPVQSPASPARPAAQAPILEADAPPADAVVLDASLRGFLEFDAEDGRAMTLVVYDARSRGELLRKHYDDGVIYEYIDFSQFALPLEQISVEYRDAADRVVLNPALVVGDQLDD